VRFVVLHAHPLESSLSVTLRERVVRELSRSGHDVEVVRLTQGEHIAAVELAGAGGLVLVYPTWWGGLPAPLLRWVQQELAPWIDDSAAMATSPLRTVQHLLAVTTHGSSSWVNRLQGEPGRQLLKRSVAKLCAPGTKLRWVALYRIDQVGDDRISAFINTVGSKVASLPA